MTKARDSTQARRFIERTYFHLDDASPEHSITLAVAQDELLLEEDHGDSLLSDDLLDDSLDDTLDDSNDLLDHVDPLADPLASPRGEQPKRQNRFDSHEMLPAGGWYRDDLTLSIRYRGGGHADPVLKSAIEMISQLSSADPTRGRLLCQPRSRCLY